MDFYDLTPAIERLWINEVRHLHSLWRRGPPRRPNPSPSSVTPAALGPSKPTAFKREERKKQRKAEKLKRRAEKAQLLLQQEQQQEEEQQQEKKKQEEQQQQSSSDLQLLLPAPDHPSGELPVIEWPCKAPPEPLLNAAGWGDPRCKQAPAAEAPPLSEEEQVKLAWTKVQQKCVSACRDFFQKNSDDEGGDEDDLMDGDDGGVGPDYFRFFLGLFEGEGDLRGYYENNWEMGEFCCFVCNAIGVKLGKRFVDCVGLVLHANTISKTKKKGAHRAFGRAVCRVLGWDISRLPSIVLDMGEPLGRSLAKAADPQKECAGNQNNEIPKGNNLSAGTEEGDVMDCVETIDISDTPTEDLPKEGAYNQNVSLLEEAQEPVNRNSKASMDHMEIWEIPDTPKG